MSHVTECKAEITDLKALAAACEEIGLELVVGQKTFKWWGRHVGDYAIPAGFKVEDMGRCEHAIRIKGNPSAYEIGVVRRRDAAGNLLPGFTLLYDFYGGGRGMSKVAGDRCQHVIQQYAAARIKRGVRRTSRVQQQRLADGTIKLTLTR